MMDALQLLSLCPLGVIALYFCVIGACSPIRMHRSSTFSRTQRKNQSARINGEQLSVAKPFFSSGPCPLSASVLHLLSFICTKGGESDLKPTCASQNAGHSMITGDYEIIFGRLWFNMERTTLHQ